MTQGLCESESPSCWGNRVGGPQSRVGALARLPGERSWRWALREKELGLKATGFETSLKFQTGFETIRTKVSAGRGVACANAQGHEQWVQRETAPLPWGRPSVQRHGVSSYPKNHEQLEGF